MSREGEAVPFKRQVKHINKVEDWLNKVQDEMRNTLYRSLQDGLKDFNNPETDKKKWVMAWPAQTVMTVDMIAWCLETENKIIEMGDNPEALTEWYQSNEE